MKTLIIPDLHANKAALQRIERVIANESPDRVVYLGDYFDFWGDGPDDARCVALWLRTSLADTKRVHLIGNHDTSYLWPCKATYCPGWTVEKQHAVEEALGNAAKQFLFFYYVDGWLLTHAGLGSNWVPHGVSLPEWLAGQAQAAVDAYTSGRTHWFSAVGGSRGGGGGAGGILWADWSEPRFPVRQILGHTPAAQVGRDGDSICLDVNYGHGEGPRCYAVCIDGAITLHEIAT